MTISLCMIVKDEATRLPACLDSVAAWVDEIIIVDTGSTDGTVEVAQNYGAHLIFFDWMQDFAAARNASLEAATKDWILVLDADEQLTLEAAQQLQQIDRKSLQGVAADDLIAAVLLRQEVGTQQSPYTLLTRFFRNRADIRFQRPYHETVDDSLEAIKAQDARWQIVALAGIAISHAGYQAEAIVGADKFQRARAIMEQHLAKHPQDGYILNKLGSLYVQQDALESGLHLLRQGLQTTKDPLTRYELHYHLGLAYRKLQEPALAQRHYQEALAQLVPPMIRLGSHINLGSLLRQIDYLELAIEQFQQAIRIDPSCAIAHFNLGVVYRRQGQLKAAAQAYREAITHRPDYAEAHQNLGIVLYKQGNFKDCIAAFKVAIQCYGNSNPAIAQQLLQGIQNLGLPKDLLAEAHLL